MFERFTGEARLVVVHAQQHARRLGHRFIGCEHLLLAVAGTQAPTGAVLREHGVTPEQVEEQIVRRMGLGVGAGLFAGLDRDALAAIGVDLDAVRARVEARFDGDALARAGHAVQCGGGRPRRRLGIALPSRLFRRRRARRPVGARAKAQPRPMATGRYRAPEPSPAGHIPFTPRAKKALERSLREALARHDGYIGVEHVSLGLLAMDEGMVPPILSALGVSASTLRAAILDRHRRAS